MEPTAPQSAAEQLIEEGELIEHAKKDQCPHAIELVKRMSHQKQVLALTALRATRTNPATMFKAMMEGWSAFKIRFELNKLAGTSGKGESK